MQTFNISWQIFQVWEKQYLLFYLSMQISPMLQAMNSEYVYLISNGSTQYYDNTLTRFTNQLSDLYTKKNSAFEVAVSQLIIDDRFQSVGVPQNDSMPTMILSKLNPTDIVCKKRNEISDNEKYFLPPSYYRHLSSFVKP